MSRVTEIRKVLGRIEALMATEIRAETGAEVKVACCGVNRWSMVGSAAAVEAAMAWVVGTGTATETSRLEDEGDVFAYFITSITPSVA